MVRLEDSQHPKHGFRVRFKYKLRAMQYLDYFGITETYPAYKFFPLNLEFDTYDELQQFLRSKGVSYDEIDIEYSGTRTESEATIVDTSKIYDIEENISKYLQEFKYYSVNEVSDMLSLSRPTIYKSIRDGDLNSIRINGQVRIKHNELQKYIEDESKKPTPATHFGSGRMQS